jgi:hypothetical protein
MTHIGKLQVRALSDVCARRVRWLYEPLIPLRTLTLVAGEGGLGKSLLLAHVTARLTRGEFMDIGPAAVLVISNEDTAEEVIVPRLIAADADRSRVHELFVPVDEGGAVVLPEHLGEIEEIARSTGAKLLWIDPIAGALAERIDSHKDTDVRRVLGRLQRLTEEADLAAVLIAHLNKAPGGDPYIRINGSVAFYNAARSVLTVTAEENDEDGRLIAQHKLNLGRRSPVLRYRLETVVLPDVLDPEDGKPIDTARLVPDGVRDDLEAGDVLGSHSEGGATRRAEAEALLTELLADGEWHEAEGLFKLATARGVTERTLYRAAKTLGVDRERRGYPATASWRSPASPATPPLPQSDGSTGNHGGKTEDPTPVLPVLPVLPDTDADTENGSHDLTEEGRAALLASSVRGSADDARRTVEEPTP